MPFKLNFKRLGALRKQRPGKSWLVLGIALSIGTVAALATRSFLTHQVQAIEARANGRKVAVVVAKGDLPKGAHISTATVAVREIPAEYAHSSAVAPDSFDRIDGQALAYPVKSGEMILWGLLEAQKPPTFSARVEDGRRALTLQVDEINSISGMLEPGDMIDLIVTVDQGGRKRIAPLLQGVRVMATGQRVVDDPASGERRQYSTLTLDTTPEQARDLILAREAGKLTALLRNPQDERGAGLASSLADLMPAAPAAPAAALPRARKTVPVLYGGSAGANQSPEALRLVLPPQPLQPALPLPPGMPQAEPAPMNR
jgi:pilus assembly protein CpaB